MIEPISPSVWRRASQNTALNVSAVRIASGDYQACPRLVVRGAAFQPAIAPSLNQTVRLARWPKLASYADQLVTLRCCFGMWWRRAALALNGIGSLESGQETSLLSQSNQQHQPPIPATTPPTVSPAAAQPSHTPVTVTMPQAGWAKQAGWWRADLSAASAAQSWADWCREPAA
jgi:hypothetical protein